MEKYTVRITGVVRKPRSPCIEAKDGNMNATIAGVVVEPPITVGPGFTQAVLGRGGTSSGVTVSEGITTSEKTAFIVTSERINGQEGQFQDIEKVAERIGQLANDPDIIADMMDEDPFSGPVTYKEWETS